MKNKTDYKKMKRTFEALLETKPVVVNQGFGIVSHPFTPMLIAPVIEPNTGSYDFVDITEDEGFEKFKAATISALDKCYEVEAEALRYFFLIHGPYLMLAFKLVEDCLSKEDYNEVLRYCYQTQEYPNRDINVNVKELIKYFEKADKTLMMEPEEIEMLDELGEDVVIYRGYHSDDVYDAMSWTTDLEVAQFFAKRFDNKNGVIIKAMVKKENILAYFDGEYEVIVNPKKVLKKEKLQ